MLKALSDLSDPILSPTKRLCEANAVRTLASPWEMNPRRYKASLGLLFSCVREGGRVLASEAAHQCCSTGSQCRGGEGGEMHLHGKYFRTHQRTSGIGMIFAT